LSTGTARAVPDFSPTLARGDAVLCRLLRGEGRRAWVAKAPKNADFDRLFVVLPERIGKIATISDSPRLCLDQRIK
jgi:hypothetical protein